MSLLVQSTRIIMPSTSPHHSRRKTRYNSYQHDIDLDYSDEEEENIYEEEARKKNLPLPITPTIIIDEVNEVVAKRYRHRKNYSQEPTSISVGPRYNESNLRRVVPSDPQYQETKTSENEDKSWFPLNMKVLLSTSSDGRSSNDNDTMVKDDKVVDHDSHDITVQNEIIGAWLQKKGSGKDIFGNKNWKQRWVRLAIAQVPGYDVDVPVILVSWHNTINPSTIIILDSRIAVPVDRKESDDNDWNEVFCFDVVQSGTTKLSTLSPTSNKSSPRIFCCSTSEERDTWVKQINEAIFEYEKRAIKALNLPPTPPRSKRSRRRRTNQVELRGINLIES